MSEKALHVCYASDLHPYECGGKCIHCQAKRLKGHNPRRCWLCWDGDPDGMPGVAASLKSAQRIREREIVKRAKAIVGLLRDLPDIAAKVRILTLALEPADRKDLAWRWQNQEAPHA